MKDYGIFDVMGPIMIGPSSSHTAGAARLARLAAKISGKDFEEVTFYLHGSFAKTYLGHGTDKALVAGVMGMLPDDDNLPYSHEIARKKGLKYSFVETDLGDVHPNSVKIVMKYPTGRIASVTGSSIGGGNIKIIDIDGLKLDFTNDFPTIVLKYGEQKGIISFVSTILAESGYNIEKMITDKSDDMVTLLVEVSEEPSEEILDKILNDKRFAITKFIQGGY
ncbi:L-serine ammonia-lyase, iron-sulfur-dependent subunit beta [Criibacterium bergeronii]|uniref:L-serine deaminase n=1 Tax=Criibacterium bergeronii TaxID=1871336 RepID=A0A371IK06_9FIRM|nr:L-serine ammonia-lyase, iron-sulfur-dependent subunit beta [Criibacterium bergeronii]MBS6063319.1 L-serine ammonia-lyase, iron-sulfur-dependent subunit beta [Peptostreptococcaceae bacterium]RDY20794.1 L-serine ammonia-lyase, iron-sulfur-dependent, subunit beta [Criibacterium bergeronii]TRW26076.1 L-serine ammonia-lyase, iron-sulfur-dependent, subunit beta [Criibacterium bergeronii]